MKLEKLKTNVTVETVCDFKEGAKTKKETMKTVTEEYSFKSLCEIVRFLNLTFAMHTVPGYEDYKVEVWYKGLCSSMVKLFQVYDEKKKKYVPKNGTIRHSLLYKSGDFAESLEKYFTEKDNPRETLFAKNYDINGFVGVITATTKNSSPCNEESVTKGGGNE